MVLNVADNATYGVEIIEPVIEFVRTELQLAFRQVVPPLLLSSSKPGKDRKQVGWGRKAEPILIFG